MYLCVYMALYSACTCYAVPLQILRVRFDNGEEDKVEIKNLEPADDFSPPCAGSTVCCKVKGGKYSAEILTVESAVPCVIVYCTCMILLLRLWQRQKSRRL